MYTIKFPQRISGQLYYDKKTKHLAKRIPSGTFALLHHEDIDEMAALSLIQKQVKGVLNCAPSMSGKYSSIGTIKLIEANIPVYDVNQSNKIELLVDQGDVIFINGKDLWLQKNNASYLLSTLTPYTTELIHEKLFSAKTGVVESLKVFTENTLHYALQEMNEILKPVPIPKLKRNFHNRHVVVVTRGSGYFEDLLAIRNYIEEKKPIMIGVDGGADAIIESGYRPDIIIGDMDSVSSEALMSGSELVVHAYTNGHAPGLSRIKEHHLHAHLFPCFGTSEDAAYLLAYHAGASLIVTLGSHTNMIDFLEKGRRGMGSTLLVRLKIGEKLVDAKGVRLLYAERGNPSWIRLASSSLLTMSNPE